MKDQSKTMLHELSTTIDEMVSSARGAKGDPFAVATAVAFEAMQVMEIVVHVASYVDAEHLERIRSLAETAAGLMHSIIGKVCDPLSDEEVDDAMKLATEMTRRRRTTVEAINRGEQE